MPFDEERVRDADPTSGEPDEQNAYPGADPDAGPQAGPGTGGYGPDRDPKTDMPRVPSVPASQDDEGSHDAAPDLDSPPRQASD